MALPSPEEALLYRIQEQNQGLISPEAVGTMGAAAGALAGIAAGNVVHQTGRGLNALVGRQGNRFKPGMRLAGGILGAALGGGLGIALRNEAVENSPEARLLAEMQVRGIRPEDKVVLEQMLADTYSKMGVV